MTEVGCKPTLEEGGTANRFTAARGTVGTEFQLSKVNKRCGLHAVNISLLNVSHRTLTSPPDSSRKVTTHLPGPPVNGILAGCNKTPQSVCTQSTMLQLTRLHCAAAYLEHTHNKLRGASFVSPAPKRRCWPCGAPLAAKSSRKLVGTSTRAREWNAEKCHK